MTVRQYARALFLALAAAGVVENGGANEETSGFEFRFDDPPEARYEIAPRLFFGADLTTTLELSTNPTLDQSVQDDRLTLEPSLDVSLAYRFTDELRLTSELEVVRKQVAVDERDEENSRTTVEVTELSLSAMDVFPGLSLQLGRQRFEDERQWWYDERLDGARVFFRSARISGELSAVREGLFGSGQQNAENVLLVVRGAYVAQHELALRTLWRRGRASGSDKRVYFGLRAHGEAGDSARYWADTALLLGRSRGKDLRAYALDTGVTWELPRRFRPSATLGIAFGSGDSNSGDDTDRSFRQTGLHDNEGEFNGLATFKYYGVTLQPELSNLMVTTLAAGARPTPDSSVDVVYHYYRQHHASTRIGDAEIDSNADGANRSLGHALDFVGGHRISEGLEVEAAIGVFFPGPALEDDASPSIAAKLELAYRF